ncbi:MAG: DUF1343 domain-containing protein [Cyclobacteriaceae bacterium]|nr:DUF1343 domain-containing protein [Cyclobacteriaceae bacterium]
MKRLFLLVVLLSSSACGQVDRLVIGADQLDVLLPKLAGKRVALMVNHTALVGKRHLADTLKARGVNLVKIFGPEHGFRGTADAGEEIKDGIDTRTGIPVVSLYGKNYKATPEQITDVDIVVFDIQDVGARFFTYISSLHYLMETCAENSKKLIVLDRPNPNGGYVDGPVRTPEQKSFVGMHPIPIAHGMTIGEYARMINGEGWLADRRTCDLEVIAMKGWKHGDRLPVGAKPSPNLPNDHAIGMYPSTCLFEGTALSIGRGTQNPFEVTGHPDLKGQPYAFTPVAIDGMDKNPKLKDQLCFGLDMRKEPIPEGVTLKYLIAMYQAFPDKDKFFIPYFDKLAGTTKLKEQIRSGLSEEEIKKSWKPELEAFKAIRGKYLLYP